MPVYFIRSEQISDNRVTVQDDLAHHLRDVLRLKVGETLTLIDEGPKRYRTRVLSTQAGRLILQVENAELPSTNSNPKIQLGIALLKGEKMDWIVQKATEIGVARLSPILTERTVIQSHSDRVERQHQRWEKIALEAAQQSCRWSIPQIDRPLSFEKLLSNTEAHSSNLILTPEAHAHPIKHLMQASRAGLSRSGTVLIGPEGGFTAYEVSAAVKAGFQTASLGDQILRAETAALVALTIVHYEMTDGQREHKTYA